MICSIIDLIAFYVYRAFGDSRLSAEESVSHWFCDCCIGIDSIPPSLQSCSSDPVT